MSSTRPAVPFAVAVGLCGVLLAGCGGSSDPATPATVTPSQPASSSAAPAAPAAAPAAPAAVTDPCALVSAAEVQAILGVAPNGAPEPPTTAGGISSTGCRWDSGGSGADLTLQVFTSDGTDTVNAMLLAMTLDGEAIPGVGDKAGLTTQGNYSVEVQSLVGAHRLSLSALGVGITARQDAVVDAAAAAADRLR
jgi:hypothetical protein